MEDRFDGIEKTLREVFERIEDTLEGLEVTLDSLNSMESELSQ